MPAIDFQQILSDSVNATKKELGSAWSDAAPFATHALRQYAEDMAKLIELRQAGSLTDEAYQYYADMQQLGLRNILLAVEGVGVIAAQNAINAVIGIVGKAVSAAIGSAL